MKTSQTQGGESVNTRYCDLSKSDKHNERLGKLSNENIVLSLTPNNYVWKDPNVPDLGEYDKKIRLDYTRTPRHCVLKTGVSRDYYRQLPTKGKTAAHPLKESVLILPKGGEVAREMAEEFVSRVAQQYKWRVIRLFVHEDEVFVNPDTGRTTKNIHAHIVWDTYSWEKHRLIRLKKNDFRKWQDFAAIVTKMPRGTDARITKAKHLTPHAHKAQKEFERAQALSAKNKELEDNIASLEATKQVLLNTNNNLQKETQKSRHQLRESLSQACKYGLTLVNEFDSWAILFCPSNESKTIRDNLYNAIEYGAKRLDESNLALFLDIIWKGIVLIERTIEELQTLAKKSREKERNTILNHLAKQKALSFFLPHEIMCVR